MKRWPLLILVPILMFCMGALYQYVPHRRAHFRVTFQPTDIANMMWWYDASDILSGPGTTIQTWTDKGPYSYDLTQVALAARPYVTNNVGQIGGQKFLYFDGVNDRFTHGGTTVFSQPNTIFVVADCYAGNFIYDGTNATRNTCWLSGGIQVNLNAGVTHLGLANSIIPNQWYLHEHTFNGVSSISATNEVNIQTANAGSGAHSGLTVGTQWPGNYPFQGGIAEIIGYNANVSAGDRALLHQYFKDKYGAYASW